MKKVTLHIPDMQSAHCRNRVQKVLSQLSDVSAENIQEGLVTLHVESAIGLEEAILAIENAGYAVKSMNDDNKSAEALLFKTNINCASCVSKVSPLLNEALGIHHWEVDTDTADKTLSVHSDGITSEQVISQVRKAGFQIEFVANL